MKLNVLQNDTYISFSNRVSVQSDIYIHDHVKNTLAQIKTSWLEVDTHRQEDIRKKGR